MKRLIYLTKLIVVLMVLSIIMGCTLPNDNQNPTVPTIPILPSALPTFTLLPQIIEEVSPTPVIVNDTAIPTQAAVTDTAIPTQVPPPTSTLCSPPAGWAVYIVQPGDNLFRISMRYNMGLGELQTANCLPSADTIYSGQTIYVPYLIPPTPVPQQPTRPEIPEGVKRQISLDTGGEPGSPPCSDATTTITPQITISQRLNDMYALCVYDFPQAEELKVDLYAPDDHWVASKTFPQSGVLNGRTLIKIKLWMPVGAPTGLWSATVTSKSVTLEKQSFLISPITGTAINTMLMGEINPFEIEKKCGFYPAGEDIMIRGSNFGVTSPLPIGVYLYTPDVPLVDGKYVLPLISTQSAEVNQGKFSISIRIQPSDPTGTYWVLPILNLNEEVYKSFDIKNDCYKVQ